MAGVPKAVSPFWGLLFTGLTFTGAASSAYLNASYVKTKDLELYAKESEVSRVIQTVSDLRTSQATTQAKAEGTEKRVDEIQETLHRMDTKIDDIRSYLLAQKGK